MNEQVEANRTLWDELTKIHEHSKFYDVESFLAGRNTLKNIELDILGDVRDKSLLHLQCHFGMDSLSFARLGADVVGVDISSNAIELAESLRDKCSLKADFICSDINELENKIDKEFDIVFTSYGVLCWLNDLDNWAKVIYNHLKAGGTFLIVEEHPLSYVFEQENGQVVLKYPYFEKQPLKLEVDGSYASKTAKIKTTVSYEWLHTTSEVIQALLNQNLIIKEFKEYPFGMYQKFESMKENEEGWWTCPGLPDLPWLFSLVATK